MFNVRHIALVYRLSLRWDQHCIIDWQLRMETISHGPRKLVFIPTCGGNLRLQLFRTGFMYRLISIHPLCLVVLKLRKLLRPLSLQHVLFLNLILIGFDALILLLTCLVQSDYFISLSGRQFEEAWLLILLALQSLYLEVLLYVQTPYELQGFLMLWKPFSLRSEFAVPLISNVFFPNIIGLIISTL